MLWVKDVNGLGVVGVDVEGLVVVCDVGDFGLVGSVVVGIFGR